MTFDDNSGNLMPQLVLTMLEGLQFPPDSDESIEDMLNYLFDIHKNRENGLVVDRKNFVSDDPDSGASMTAWRFRPMNIFEDKPVTVLLVGNVHTNERMWRDIFRALAFTLRENPHFLDELGCELVLSWLSNRQEEEELVESQRTDTVENFLYTVYRSPGEPTSESDTEPTPDPEWDFPPPGATQFVSKNPISSAYRKVLDHYRPEIFLPLHNYFVLGSYFLFSGKKSDKWKSLYAQLAGLARLIKPNMKPGIPTYVLPELTSDGYVYQSPDGADRGPSGAQDNGFYQSTGYHRDMGGLLSLIYELAYFPTDYSKTIPSPTEMKTIGDAIRAAIKENQNLINGVLPQLRLSVEQSEDPSIKLLLNAINRYSKLLEWYVKNAPNPEVWKESDLFTAGRHMFFSSYPLSYALRIATAVNHESGQRLNDHLGGNIKLIEQALSPLPYDKLAQTKRYLAAIFLSAHHVRFQFSRRARRSLSQLARQLRRLEQSKQRRQPRRR